MKTYNFLFLQTNCTCHLAILLYPTVKNSTSVADPDLQIRRRRRGGGGSVIQTPGDKGEAWSQNTARQLARSRVSFHVRLSRDSLACNSP